MCVFSMNEKSNGRSFLVPHFLRNVLQKKFVFNIPLKSFSLHIFILTIFSQVLTNPKRDNVGGQILLKTLEGFAIWFYFKSPGEYLAPVKYIVLLTRNHLYQRILLTINILPGLTLTTYLVYPLIFFVPNISFHKSTLAEKIL